MRQQQKKGLAIWRRPETPFTTIEQLASVFSACRISPNNKT